MSNVITKLSKFGLQVDNIDKWHNFSNEFKGKDSLRKGFIVDLIFNPKGKIIDIIDASPVVHSSVGNLSKVEGVVGDSTTPKASFPLPFIKDRQILKGQILNIVMDKYTQEQIHLKQYREQAYELVLVMLKELELKGYYGW